jgi:hypothetical protein
VVEVGPERAEKLRGGTLGGGAVDHSTRMFGGAATFEVSGVRGSLSWRVSVAPACGLTSGATR